MHHVAGMRVLLPSAVETVQPKCYRRASLYQGCDTVAGTFVFANHVPADIFATYLSAVFSGQYTVVGTDGDLVIKRVPGKPGYTLSLRHLDPSLQPETYVPFCGIDKEFETFVASVNRRQMHPDLSAKAAFNDVATVYAMHQASETDGTVHVLRPGQNES